MKVTPWLESYVQPDFVSPFTVNLIVGTDFLLSDELVTTQLPEAFVEQVAPDPGDQVPVTETPATGPFWSTT